MGKKNKTVLIRFFIYWLFVAFPMGLFTLLMGPTKWVISLSAYFSWSETIESFLQKLVIVLFVIISFLLARWLNIMHPLFRTNAIRWGVFSFVTLLFLFSVYMFSFHPEKLITLSESEEHTSLTSTNAVEFVFGAYPEEAKLLELKKQGYDGVITLMNDLVVPAEPKLIRQEKAAAAKVGILLLHIPMLPWVSGNQAAVRKIDSLAKESKGKYYVHCYLGRDRVNAFKNIVESHGVATKMELKENSHRHLEEIKQLERGKYIKLQNEVYFTPLPTDEEFFGYVVAGQFKTVISILDPQNKDDKQWIEKEAVLMKQYALTFANLSLLEADNEARYQFVIDSINKLPNPKLIHAYYSDSPVSKKFIKQYFKKTGLRK